MSPPDRRELVIDARHEGQRLDKFLQHALPEVSRGALRKLIDRGDVRVDDHRSASGARLRAGQSVTLPAWLSDERPLPQPELPLAVLAERPELVAINKPPGRPCHPLLPGETETVANALVARFAECADAAPAPREGGLVHRLDRATSGVLIAARDRATYLRLRDLFRRGEVIKEYIALVAGRVDEPGEVARPIDRQPGDPSRVRALTPHAIAGQTARTRYEPLAQTDRMTLLRATSRSGRRHQVRVHLAAIGHPLVADAQYGGPPDERLAGPLLHASRVDIDGLTFCAELPEASRQLLRELFPTTDLAWPG